MRTGAGKVVTLLRLVPTPSGPSPMHIDGIPSVSLPESYPIHPSVSSCKLLVECPGWNGT